ncbi:MAG: hypothetical protein JNL79_18325 [Myxococcales bacterium]|nr:hypothetical protein [Myxococcales bacterium]
MEDLRDLERLARIVLHEGLPSTAALQALLERLRLEVQDDDGLLQAWQRIARCPVTTEADRRRFFHAARNFLAASRAARPHLDYPPSSVRKSVPVSRSLEHAERASA